MKFPVSLVLSLLLNICALTSVYAQVPTGNCSDALPFCTGSNVNFPASIDAVSPIVSPTGGDDVGCLGSTPNPAWYFMKIGVAGSISFEISGVDGSQGPNVPTNDIDFICWGPFLDPSTMCSQVSDYSFADNDANIIGCSYNGGWDPEYFTIANAQVGEFYLVLLTNFSNTPCNVLFGQTSGSGQTDCDILCENAITAIPSACSPATDTYSLSGQITLVNPPSTGTLTVTDGNGGSQVFNAPFAGTLNYSISSLPSNGGNYAVTASFSDAVCASTANYAAPGSCMFCSITAGYSGPACAGTDVNLTATNSAIGATYTWTGPNGFNSNVQNPVLTAATVAMSGTYTASVFNALNNCQSSSSVDVIVYPIPAMPAIVSNSPVCPGAAFNFSGPAPTAGASTDYAWFGPSAFAGNTQSVSVPSAQLAQEGDYTLIVTENGCASPVGTTAASLFPLPVPNAGSDVETCSGVSVQIGVAAVPGFSYSWSPATRLDAPALSNPTLTGNNNSVAPLLLTYTLTVSDGNCSASDEMVATIDPEPDASFVAPQPQCFGVNNFSFSANGSYSNAAVFEWSFGPFATPSASAVEDPSGVSFSSTGLQNVTLRITDRGCISTLYEAPVMVYEMPVANFDADIFEACDPELITFTNLTTSNDPISSYDWSFGNGRSSPLSDPAILFSNPGTFDITLTATSDKGCRNAYKIPEMIVIHSTPKADFTMSRGLMTIVDPFTYVKDLSSGADEMVYQVTGLPDIFEASPKITFPDTGIYNITQVVSTAYGCSSSVTKQAQVEFGFKVYIPTSFTPNDDGKNDRFMIYGEDVAQFKMEIFNRWGQLIYVSFDMENGWDGKTAVSERTETGTLYMYKVTGVDKRGVKTNYEGTVMLLK